MKLIIFIINTKLDLIAFHMIVAVSLFININLVKADSLSYSPDQWPGHWNEAMDDRNYQTSISDYDRCNNNCERQNNYYSKQRPAKSPIWGMAPVSKDKPRRTVRPEYNSNSHMMRYEKMKNNYSPYYSAQMIPAMGGLVNPYAGSVLNPYAVPVMVPGLAAPGIPFSVNSYGMNPYANYSYAPMVPGMGYAPGVNYLW
ncbi:MAG: hypothetical protein OEY29_06285 [Gammaproteobacteria bacterium]|nr:hypothetical protein [Gammaproteobacteria bacterium]